MPYLTRNGVDVYYEDSGNGHPIIWSHEFAGDHRSWATQVGWFSRTHRNIVYSNRGFPPSTVPDDASAYSQDELIEDLYALVQHLGVEKAHFVGLSMGASVVLNFGIRHPERCASLTAASGGSGTVGREEFDRGAREIIRLFREQGMEAGAGVLGAGPTRAPLEHKDPQAYALFHAELLQHDPIGMAHIYENVQLKRPTFYQLEEQLREIGLPTLVIVGDEDEPVLEPALFLKRTIPGAGLRVFARTGHCINLEEPADFNSQLTRFFDAVERGKWIDPSV